MFEKFVNAVKWFFELLFKNPKVIPYLFLSIVLLMAWTTFKGFWKGPKIPSKPESTVSTPTIDWNDEAAAIDYVSYWLNANAQYVLTVCIPKKIEVKDCKPGVK